MSSQVKWVFTVIPLYTWNTLQYVISSRTMMQRVTIQWYSTLDYMKCKYTTVSDECTTIGTLNDGHTGKQSRVVLENCSTMHYKLV